MISEGKTTAYDEARELVRELEDELGTKLVLGYIGNCSPLRDRSRPDNYPFNYDDRLWDICFMDMGVSKSETEGRGPWSHRASGTSYPCTPSWRTDDWPSLSDLRSMILRRYERAMS